MDKSFSIFSLLFFLCFLACQNAENNQIEALKREYGATQDFDTANELVDVLRKEAAKQKQNDQGFSYFVQAAELQFTAARDAVSAVRWLDDAIRHYGNEQTDRAAAYGLLAEIYREYRFKSDKTVRLDLSDIDKMKMHLQGGIKKALEARATLKKDMVQDSTMGLNPKLADRFVNLSEGIALFLEKTNPSMAAELNFESGNASRGLSDFKRAIRMYYAVLDNAPEHPMAESSLFLIAFTYDNDLQDYENAKKAYEEVLRRYPNSDYAQNAKELIKVLGVPSDSLMLEK